MNVPVANVYYLLCYAWRHVDDLDVVRLEEIAGLEELHDVLGTVLAEGAFRLIRSGIDRGYREVREDLAGVRGKIAVSETAARALQRRGRLACDFEELSHDVLHNRILRSTLSVLLRVPNLDREVRERVRLAYRKLDGVRVVHLNRGLFGRVQLDRNRHSYQLLLSVCRLVHDCLLVDEQSGNATFLDFRKDRHRMWELFQDFVTEFYRREQRTYQVNRHGRRIAWNDAGTAEHDRARIPRMEGDLLLDSPTRRIILDTKYYAEALTTRYGVRKLRPSHLYQILAYLRNREATADAGPRHEGMLLYPVVDAPLAVDVCLEGFSVRARGIDLAQDWRGIHVNMLALIA